MSMGVDMQGTRVMAIRFVLRKCAQILTVCENGASPVCLSQRCAQQAWRRESEWSQSRTGPGLGGAVPGVPTFVRLCTLRGRDPSTYTRHRLADHRRLKRTRR